MLNFPKLKLQSDKPLKEKSFLGQRGASQEFEIRNSAFQQTPGYVESVNKTRLSSIEDSNSPKMRVITPLLHSEGMSFKVTVKKSDIKAQLGL